jgi:hypothetical protein
MGQDTYCHIGVYIEFDFTWKEFRRLLAAGFDRFYIHTDPSGWSDEAFNFSSEDELLEMQKFYNVKIPKEEEEVGPPTSCFVECVSGDARKILHRANPYLFKYDGKRSVDDVIDNFTGAKRKFRDLGYPEESIYVGYNFYDSW